MADVERSASALRPEAADPLREGFHELLQEAARLGVRADVRPYLQRCQNRFAELEAGASGVFVRVSDSDPEMLRYLAGRGIAPGDGFEVLHREPFDGPIALRYLRAVLAYVAVYYALWGIADVLILAGFDAGWGLRILPNQLYYSFWVPVAWTWFFSRRYDSARSPVHARR